ncbi:MAG: Uma2 family endonuclease [Desulfobacterales bacterium]|nr:Uma2 family endonuclease [Desulfobacterales bacterium]
MTAVNQQLSDTQSNALNYYDSEYPSKHGLRVSEAEYWEKYYETSEDDFSYEWNDGILEEKPVSDYEGYLIHLWFQKILDLFLNTYPIAKMIGLDMGFRLALPHKTTIRKPDIGVLLKSNPVDIHGPDRSYKGVFDVCIEVLSDSKKGYSDHDTIEKKNEYSLIKVQEYYILDSKQEKTAFYQLKSGIYHPIKPIRGIIKSNVLKGFQFRIEDLYKQPSLEKMSNDMVYHQFILPFYQLEKLKAKQEKQRAELAEIKAQEEKQRAELAEIKAQEEKQRAELAEIKAQEEKQRAKQAEQKLSEVLSKLKQLGISIE